MIDRLIEINTGSAIATSLTAARWANDPALASTGDALTAAQGKATAGIWERIDRIRYHFGREQGLSEAEVGEMVAAAAKR